MTILMALNIYHQYLHAQVVQAAQYNNNNILHIILYAPRAACVYIQNFRTLRLYYIF